MNTVLIQIKKLIEIYFNMADNESIEDYLHEIIFFHNDLEIIMTYRTLKHIVEQRKKDSYGIDIIHSIFVNLEKLLHNRNYQIIKNQTSVNAYIFTEKTHMDKKGIFIILELTNSNNSSYYIKTAFFRLAHKIKKFIQKIT